MYILYGMFPGDLDLLFCTYVSKMYSRIHCKKAARNSDLDIGGANQTKWGSENSHFYVLWFCATVANIGIWRIPTWLFYSVFLSSRTY